MDEYPSIFKRSKFGHYICACDKWFTKDEQEDAVDHFYSGSIDGYCVNGIKRLELTDEIEKDTYECVCGTRSDRYDIFETHFRIFGKQCVTARNRKYESYCEICDRQCASIANYIVHCKTTKHKERKEGIQPVPLQCDVCKITTKGYTEMRAHLETKKHQTMVASGTIAEEKISLHCDTCNITCPSQKTMRTHLQTKKHLKKMDLLTNI